MEEKKLQMTKEPTILTTSSSDPYVANGEK
jgi:hypothetical protein